MVDPKLTYQGRPCKYGHSGQRWISKRTCVECTQFRARQWYRDRHSYHNWCSMKQRCYNPNNPSYEHYGAKGITVCDRWRKSFVDFLADVGDPPPPRSARLWTIDRIDSRGNYERSNVRWVATWTDQKRNFPTN